jgi:hypothetical protein
MAEIEKDIEVMMEYRKRCASPNNFLTATEEEVLSS